MSVATYPHDQAVIEEFRANEGQVGGYFAHLTLLLLHHKGAKSGQARINPLACLPVEGGWAVFASKGGADENPAWYYNLLADPNVTVEFGTETFKAKAREAYGDEYERIWSQQKADAPQFAEYERNTKRDRIPVLILERV